MKTTESARIMTEVLFLGTATVTPTAGADTACVMLNGNTLVDTGWNPPVNMMSYGTDPLDVDYLFITHCHHDHYIGLPQLLFFHAMRQRAAVRDTPLTIVGPRPDIGSVVERALAFLRHEQFPTVAAVPRIVPLQAGDTFETDRLTVSTSPTVHPVVGLCYRFHDRETGADVVVTGDTAYHTPIARHAAGAELLIHEASRGPVASDPNDRGGHSGAVDAANIARQADVKTLALTHYQPARRDENLAAAQAVFSNTVAPVEGDRLRLHTS
jgi:ribonuclease Z